MNDQPNTIATVALACGIAVVVLFALNSVTCGVFGMLIWPLQTLAALIAAVTGFMGMRQANASSTGEGKSQAVAGMVIGIGWIVFQILIFGLVFVLLGSSVVISILTGG